MPAALCLLALWLRLRGLGDLSLWVDEAFTWQNSHAPLAELLGARLNVHPPLYFLMERYWIRLVGESEYALRLSNALLGVLVVPAVWRVARSLAGRAAALAAGLGMAVAPAALSYGREARMYGTLMALAALLLLAAERLAARPTGRRWLGYGLLALATGLTHYTGMAAVGAALVRTVPCCRDRVARWLGVHAAVLALLAAWGWHFWQNRDAWAGLVWLPWAAPVSIDGQVVDWLTTIGGLPVGPIGLAAALEPARRLSLALAASVVAFALVGLVLLWVRHGWRLGAALALLSVAPLVAIVALEPVRPMWHVRFTLVGMPMVVVLAAVGGARLGGSVPRWRRASARPQARQGSTASPSWAATPGASPRPFPSEKWGLAMATALAIAAVAPELYGSWKAPPEQRDDWRAVARAVRPLARPGDVGLGSLDALAGYYLGSFVTVRQRPPAIGRPAEATVAELSRAVGPATVVWLLPTGDPLLDPNSLVNTALERYAAAREELEAGGLRITRLLLRPHDAIQLQPALRQVDERFGGALHLVGYAAERAPLGDGLVVRLSLDLRVERKLAKDYKLFAHLLDANGQTVAQRDVPLLDPARRPTSQMDPGPLRVEVAIEGPPEKVQAGRLVGVGFYDERSGERLTAEPTVPENRLPLPVVDAS